MRITFVITGLGMGGAEVQVSTLAAGFSGRGATVQIVSMLSKIAEHPQLSRIPVSTLAMTRGKWSPRDLVRYIKTVRGYQPDIVHSHLFHANLLARIGRPFVRTPLVCTVDTERFHPDGELRRRIREELGLGDVFTWIWIGRIEEQKDPWTILQAFKTAAASDRACALLVVGSGSLEQQMQQRAAELGIASQVRFMGLRGDIPALLNGADGYVLSSI